MNQSDRLVKLRQQSGLTQREAGQRAGVSHSRINAYEKKADARIKLPVLRKLASLYGCTVEYILEGKEAPAVPARSGGQMPSVIVTDGQERERVVFVPVRAQAGYPKSLHDPEFISELQTFSLPGFVNGTYRIFEVEGESMYPRFHPADQLICTYVEGFDQMRDGNIYVLVCLEGILVKRCVNAIQKRGAVIIESENPDYKPDVIMASDILEVWEFVARITRN